MRIKVSGGLSTNTGTQAINEVVAHHREYRTDIHLTILARFYVVLHKNLQARQDIFETSHSLHAIEERAHRLLALRQIHLPMLLPEGVILHLGIGINHRLSLASEQLLGNLLKCIVRQSGGLDSHTFL